MYGYDTICRTSGAKYSNGTYQVERSGYIQAVLDIYDNIMPECVAVYAEKNELK